jgi:hydroxymethylbilane synthase
LALRPDLKTVDIRGNVDTRIRKVYGPENLSGVILAAAGVLRLGRESEITEFLKLERWLPAPGQGALAIMTRRDDEAREIAATINHTGTRTAVSAERALLSRMNGGCHVPVGAWGHIEGETLFLNGFIGHPDGLRIVRGEIHGPKIDPESLGTALAEQLLDDGGREVLDDLRRSGRI